jgi:gliding-associated putative ABC transporter substrate-binding component GldG
MVVGNVGDQPQMQLMAWPYFPVLSSYANHPISKNLEPVRALFPTALDTVEASGIRKTSLLQSSNNSRLLEAPAKIDFEFLQIAPDEREFKKGPVTVAYLLEGRFRSLYANRIPRAFRDSLTAMQYPVLNEAEKEGKMILVSDGDIAMNQYSPRTGPLPMGTNVFTQFTFANREFFMNSMEYLVNPSDILQTRSKSLTLRLLDPQKTGENRSMWQLINIGLPLIILIVAALIYNSIRRRRFARQA